MKIVIERGKTVSLDTLPEYSIAVDGFCQGPKIDTEHHRYSFDHHAGCLRFCTISACMQALTAIQLGLDPEPYTVFANDIDGDVCAAIWCLQNPDRVFEPLVIKLINAIGIGDMHSGSIHQNGMTKTVEWVLDPETSSKRNNDYSKLCDDSLSSILEAVLHRISSYVDADAGEEIAKHQKHGEYNVIRNENNWALIESQDPHALGNIWHAGFERIVLMRKQSDSSIAYTFAKKSDFINGFPLEKIYEEVNKIETGTGGSSCIGGSVRNANGSRSNIGPEDMIKIIDGVLLGKRKVSKRPVKKH